MWRSINSLDNILGCLGVFHGAPLASNTFRYNPFPVLEVSFGGERCQVVALSSALFGDCIYISFLCVHTLRSLNGREGRLGQRREYKEGQLKLRAI